MAPCLPLPLLVLAVLAAPSLADAQGKALFTARCAVCHQAETTAAAPSLEGVFGRPIASLSGFAYSAALRTKSGERWTRANLDAFLSDPNAFAPGTAMYAGPLTPEERSAIIAYLMTLKAPASAKP
ncbi:MAG: c-type cytochrome [Caulobacteraceae bacterium]